MRLVIPSTFPQLLSRLLHSDAARPRVTFYDDAGGERVELSGATYANWVAKTAGLLQDELDAERGDLVLLDLPTHWLGAVWLGASWAAGLCVTADRELAGEAAVVVCGPDRVAEYAPLAADRPVVGLSLRPLGGRFVEPLPSGVVDYGAVVLAQPDSFAPVDPPAAGDAAWREGSEPTSQEALIASVAEHPLVEVGGRLLTDSNPTQVGGPATLISPMLRDGATVWVANPDEARWQHRYDEERATSQLRAASGR